MGLIYIGVLLCAVAFAVVAIFASLALKRAADTMETFSKTLGDVEQKMNYITPELRKTLEETGRATDDLHDKLGVANGLFDSVQHMGGAIHTCNRLLHTKTNRLSALGSPNFVDKLTETLKWGEVANQVYHRWKRDGKNEGNRPDANEKRTGDEG
ncbi:DUF948 domain-containing protein [Lentibacillus lipolyticus]|nr:DUF948 domain-containing protein [Lentibacillus lipolyticus]